MPNAIALRPDFDASLLRGLVRRSKDAAQARSMFSLAVIYDGGSHTEAGRLGAKSRPTLTPSRKFAFH